MNKVTKTQMVADLQSRSEDVFGVKVSKAAIERFLKMQKELQYEYLKDGKSFTIDGIGTVKTVHQEKREHKSFGVPMVIPAKTVVKFTLGSGVKKLFK